MKHDYTIRDIRKGLGLNQAQLGSLLGSTASTISRWEAGLFSPTPYQQALLNAFGDVQEGRTATETSRVGTEAIRLLGAQGIAAALLHLLMCSRKQ